MVQAAMQAEGSVKHQVTQLQEELQHLREARHRHAEQQKEQVSLLPSLA